jgi:hypothetical protein
MKKQLSILALFGIIGLSVFAQQKMTREMYIDKYYMTAVREMNAHAIPASITLAQGILESGNGNSRLSVQANNHFGIKCHAVWDGPFIRHDDDAKQECFRKYASADESYRDHSLFLTTRNRYASLFELKPDNYKGWARGLKKAGYATSPTYASHLIRLIEDYNLDVYDSMNYQRLLAEKGLKEEMVLTAKEDSVIGVASLDPIAPKATKANALLEILKHKNNINYLIAGEQDNIASIAARTDVWDWEIKMYNNLAEDQNIVSGQMVFLQPKRRRGYTSFHMVKAGDTLEEISSEYGIKIKWILKRSRLTENYVAQEGDKLWLRGRKRKDKSAS